MNRTDSNDAPPLGGFGSPADGFGPPPTEPLRVPPFAIASMIFGALAIPGCWCSLASLPLSSVGLALGILALRQAQAHPDLQRGRGVAWAGITLNVIALSLAVVTLVT